MGLLPDFSLPSWEDIDESLDEFMRDIPGHGTIEDGVCWLDAFIDDDVEGGVGEDDGELFYCYETPNLETSERTRDLYEFETGWVASATGIVNEIWQFILKGIGVAYTAVGGLPFAAMLTLLNGYLPKKPDPVYSRRKDCDPLPMWRAYEHNTFLPRKAVGSSWNLPTWSLLPVDPQEQAVIASWVVGTGLYETKAEEFSWLSRA